MPLLNIITSAISLSVMSSAVSNTAISNPHSTFVPQGLSYLQFLRSSVANVQKVFGCRMNSGRKLYSYLTPQAISQAID